MLCSIASILVLNMRTILGTSLALVPPPFSTQNSSASRQPLASGRRGRCSPRPAAQQFRGTGEAELEHTQVTRGSRAKVCVCACTGVRGYFVLFKHLENFMWHPLQPPYAARPGGGVGDFW